jgi:uncharacterized Ntn-hydrolase superfamily protein
MKKILYSIFLGILLGSGLIAQDTFSIVAVDPETGEVGSAGASCIDDSDCNGCGGAIIISGLLPGRGGINAQAQVCLPNINLNNGLGQMQNDLSPDEILDWLLLNDGCVFGNTTERQYGIVDFDPMGNPRSTAFTGSNCVDYKNHITGTNYAIQGNILLGQQILDEMEAGFLETEGSLAEKLMAALQGANVVGADTRCTSNGTSSLSAFIRVARPNDTPGNFHLELNVPELPAGQEPIDSLQTLFDQWNQTVGSQETSLTASIKVFPNPAQDAIVVQLSSPLPAFPLTISLFDIHGRLVFKNIETLPGDTLSIQNLPDSRFLFLDIRDAKRQLIFSEEIIRE